MKHIRLLILTILLSIAGAVVAQTEADNLYLQGQKLQQTMTIAKQREAIKKFEAAKVIYTSSSKKAMCDNQIAQCKKNISSLKAAPKPKKVEAAVEEKPVEEVVETHKDVQLSLSESVLTFKYKPKDGSASVVVNCNYDDWEITYCPDWVTVNRATTRFYVDVEKNPGKESRSDHIMVKCGDKEAILIINQEGPTWLKKLTNKASKALDNM